MRFFFLFLLFFFSTLVRAQNINPYEPDSLPTESETSDSLPTESETSDSLPIDRLASFQLGDIYFGASTGFSFNAAPLKYSLGGMQVQEKYFYSYNLGGSLLIPLSKSLALSFKMQMEGISLERNLLDTDNQNYYYKSFQWFFNNSFDLNIYLHRFAFIGLGLGVWWTYKPPVIVGTLADINSTYSTTLGANILVGSGIPLIMNSQNQSLAELRFTLGAFIPFYGSLIDGSITSPSTGDTFRTSPSPFPLYIHVEFLFKM